MNHTRIKHAGSEAGLAGNAGGNALAQLAAHGQSCWLDDLSRRMMLSGELPRLVEQGVRGVTANPATVAKAIMSGSEYDRDIERAAAAGHSAPEIYEALVVADIRQACDIFRRVYEEAKGRDGFVSLEVSPHLAHDTSGSITEAKRLWAAVDRPNLFIKIPGTQEGVPAIEQLLVDGININVTLLFSVTRYEAVAHAYLQSITRRITARRPIANIASVASFFLSRIDVLVDELLHQRIADCTKASPDPDPERLIGKIAVSNAKLAFQSCKQLLRTSRWKALVAHGAQVQRLLWASTGTKNPSYPESIYVEPLIGSAAGPRTVNTMPAKTIAAFLDHGTVQDTVEEGIEDAHRVMNDLERLGIGFEEVAAQLENEGIQKFIESYDEVLRHIAAKRKRFASV